MHLFQAAACYVCVDLGGADTGMTEQFLNDPQIGPMLQKMCCKTVAQHVWCHVAADSCATYALFDPQP